MRLLISLLMCLQISASVFAQQSDLNSDLLIEERMTENLEKSARWIMEEGVSVYTNHGRDVIFDTLLDKWGTQLWVEPLVDGERHLAQFRIKARDIRYQILNLYRTNVEEIYYEFWIARIEFGEDSRESRRTEFFVVKTKDIYGSREIVAESDQFISQFEVGDDLISFPKDNLDLIYDMAPWLYPENYQYSDLDDSIVVIENGVAKIRTESK